MPEPTTGAAPSTDATLGTGAPSGTDATSHATAHDHTADCMHCGFLPGAVGDEGGVAVA